MAMSRYIHIYTEKQASADFPKRQRIGTLTTSRSLCIYSYFSVFAFFQNITFLLYYNVERISPGSGRIFHSDVGRSIFIASSKFPARSNFKTGRLRQVTCVISLYICGCNRHRGKIAYSQIARTE